jgi:hypothetical protein
VPSRPVAELVKDAVAVGLLHLGVNVVTRVAELGNLLGKQLDAVHRVAKDDALVDFQLGEEGVEAMHLLALFYVGVELSDSAQREFVHEIDAVGVRNELLAKGFHGDGKRCAKEADLMILVAKIDNSGDNNLSASSMMMVRVSPRLATFFEAKSRMRPGVATMMWMELYRRMISSLSEVPPVVTMHWMPMCFPISFTIAEVCNASSRVGMRIKTKEAGIAESLEI